MPTTTGTGRQWTGFKKPYAENVTLFEKIIFFNPLSLVHFKYECCGMTGPADWEHLPGLPSSCCPYDSHREHCDINYHHDQGCRSLLVDTVFRGILLIASTSLVIGFLQVCGLDTLLSYRDWDRFSLIDVGYNLRLCAGYKSARKQNSARHSEVGGQRELGEKGSSGANWWLQYQLRLDDRFWIRCLVFNYRVWIIIEFYLFFLSWNSIEAMCEVSFHKS